MKSFEILVSCMDEDTISLVKRSNIRSDCVVVDQCNENIEETIDFEFGSIKRVCTTERGLSNSRNMAIEKADSAYCLIADDDEIFVDDLKENVLKAYSEIPEADIIVFGMTNFKSKIENVVHKMKKHELLRVSSWMISFKLKSIRNKIYFDNKIGSGTGNGGGEEIKFLIDCYKAGLKIYYHTFCIGEVNHNKSMWFGGYNKKYFFQRGATTRYYMGLFWSFTYGLYFIVTKRNLYTANMSMIQATKYLIAGIRANIK